MATADTPHAVIQTLIQEKIDSCKGRIQYYTRLDGVLAACTIIGGIASTVSSGVALGEVQPWVPWISLGTAALASVTATLQRAYNPHRRLERYKALLPKLEGCLIALHEEHADLHQLRQMFERYAVEMSQVSSSSPAPPSPQQTDQESGASAVV